LPSATIFYVIAPREEDFIVGQPMSRAAEFRRNADECRQQAAKSRNHSDGLRLQSTGCKWRRRRARRRLTDDVGRPRTNPASPVMLTTDELKAVDEFRFEHLLPSRAVAVRELMRRGLLPAKGDDSKPH
jgi:hypothetical protein